MQSIKSCIALQLLPGFWHYSVKYFIVRLSDDKIVSIHPTQMEHIERGQEVSGSAKVVIRSYEKYEKERKEKVQMDGHTKLVTPAPAFEQLNELSELPCMEKSCTSKCSNPMHLHCTLKNMYFYLYLVLFSATNYRQRITNFLDSNLDQFIRSQTTKNFIHKVFLGSTLDVI